MTQLKGNLLPRPTLRSTSATTLVDILILGAGWTYQFLLPLLEQQRITHAATTRNGHDETIPFQFSPDTSDTAPYERLPPARTVLITFPLKGDGQSRLLTSLYEQCHKQVDSNCRYIQLGSTGIFTDKGWNDSDSSYDRSNARAVAEDELLHLYGRRACVLNLAGLYGGERQPRNWITRVAKTKEEVRGKGALHLVHGGDVARAVLGAHAGFGMVGGKRWIVNDLHVYDWWDLILCWGRYARGNAGERGKVNGTGTAGKGIEDGEHAGKEAGEEKEELRFEKWVVELMQEEGVRALPRDKSGLGRVLDGRGFWNAIGTAPAEGRVS